MASRLSRSSSTNSASPQDALWISLFGQSSSALSLVWQRGAAQGIVADASAASIAALTSARQGAREIIVLLPHTWCSAARVRLGAKREARTPRALAYALEPQLASEAEQVHAAVLSEDAGGALVSIVQASLLNDSLAKLTALGITPTSVWPLPFALGPNVLCAPQALGEISVGDAGGAGGFVSHADGWLALDAPSATHFSALLPHFIPAKVAGQTFNLIEPNTARATAWQAGFAEQGIAITHQASSALASAIARGVPAGRGLLTGFATNGAQGSANVQNRAGRRNDAATQRGLAIAFALAALWIIGNFIAAGVDWWQLQGASAALRDQARSIASAALPNTVLVEPKIQLQRALGANAGADNGIGSLHAVLATALQTANLPRNAIARTQYRGNELLITWRTPPSDIAALQNAARAQGYTLSVREGNVWQLRAESGKSL